MNGVDGAIVALSSIKSDNLDDQKFESKVVFYRIFKDSRRTSERLFQIQKLEYEIDMDSIEALDSAMFVKGDFIW